MSRAALLAASSWVAVRRAGWAPLAVFGVHLLTAFVIDVYASFPEFDIPMHLAGGAAIAWFSLAWVRAAARAQLLGAPNELALGMLALGLTAVVAIAWEIAEFAADSWFLTRWSNDVPDLLADLALGLGGALACLALAARRA
ncbi:MAG: hypothetical protein IT454_09260 [Planctomycetes bacterium]|nr:hypothetical protein [Planctomycetota bacterium]